MSCDKLALGHVARRRICGTNLIAETAVILTRKPFDMFAEGLVSEKVGATRFEPWSSSRHKLNAVGHLQEAIDGFSTRLQRFFAPVQASPSQRAQKNEFLLSFAAALDQLPKDQRDVVILRDVEGSKLADIKERLGNVAWVCVKRAGARQVIG